MLRTIITKVEDYRRKPLELVEGTGEGPGGAGIPMRLIVPPSPALSGFVQAAADAGLDAAAAVRLGLERALVLADAAALGLDVGVARQRLRAVATSARPRRALVPEHADYVRSLRLGRAVPAADASGGLAVVVPARLLARALDVHPQAFQADHVPELVAWEVAAALDGRTMGEWALRVLARRLRAA